jgi:hypothetical protein
MEGVGNQNIRAPSVGSPARRVRYLFATRYSQLFSRQGGGGGDCEIFFGERRYGRINAGTRVSELAADNREAALEQGAR